MEKIIVADSSCEVDENIQKEVDVNIVPFKLYIDGEEYIDDKELNVINFISKMVKSDELPRSACPSPNDFIEKFEKAKEVFIVTISAALSGTFNSAELAKNLYKEDNPDAKVHVFNSRSASIGETLIALKIKEFIDAGLDFDEIVERVENYIASQKTLFIAESLDNLMKNGRISKFKGKLATALNIKPIMAATDEGEIVLKEKARGSNKAFKRLAQLVCENADNTGDRILAISHCNNLSRAKMLKEEIEKHCAFKKVLILQTGGLSSLYVDNQGIILTY
ncbi:DegV family protein [Fusibacter sp. JL216-2]|uniref:DegV family protein n=1 Tax=Fusibacter sp. JL216-2 TaxID=3071453 RepID=UPI003D345647